MTADDTRRWQWIAIALILGWLVWKLGPILTPFVIAAALGWLGDPLVDRLERAGRARSTSVVIVFVCMTALLALALFVLLPLLWQQLQVLIDSLPKGVAWLSGTVAPWAKAKFHVDLAHYVDPEFMLEWVRGHWEEAGGLAATVLGRISDSGLLLFSILANIALVPVLSFYFLRDWDVFVARVRELLPRPSLPVVSQLALEADQVLGGFIRGQLSVMVALGTIYAIGLWAVGLSLGLLIGFVAGLVSFVPYMGAFIGVSAAVIASLVQHGDMFHLALVLAVFAVGQTMESFVLTPWLVGDRIGLHPVAVIFAIMAGGQLFGFLGVLLALPVAAVSMVLLRYGHGRYRQSGLYGAPLPESIAEGDGPPELLPDVASNEDLPPSGPAA